MIFGKKEKGLILSIVCELDSDRSECGLAVDGKKQARFMQTK